MYTDIGVLLELELSRSTSTKSSITPEKTRTALAKMAGLSKGQSTRYATCHGAAPRSAAASSYCLPIVTSLACTIRADQLTFQLTRARTSASVPRPIGLNSLVNTKNIATPKISSGMTNDRIIRKLADEAVGPRHRLIPSANATPSGTVTRVT